MVDQGPDDAGTTEDHPQFHVLRQPTVVKGDLTSYGTGLRMRQVLNFVTRVE